SSLRLYACLKSVDSCLTSSFACCCVVLAGGVARGGAGRARNGERGKYKRCHRPLKSCVSDCQELCMSLSLNVGSCGLLLIFKRGLSPVCYFFTSLAPF
ncbi:hypothetical protein M5D96_000697, partial [Drosophila gunungcola]